MNRWKILKEMWKVWRENQHLGDFAILKSSLRPGSFEPSTETKAFLDSRPDIPDFSNLDFASMPAGSFGKSYADFMETNGLKPFRFSGRYADLARQNKLVVFYTAVHDAFHVLTGYNTSMAGEVGVWAFVGAQRISPDAEKAARLARQVFPIASPFSKKLIDRAFDEGTAHGTQAQCVLKMDFRTEFLKPLQDVRNRYEIKTTEIPEIANNILSESKTKPIHG